MKKELCFVGLEPDIDPSIAIHASRQSDNDKGHFNAHK